MESENSQPSDLYGYAPAAEQHDANTAPVGNNIMAEAPTNFTTAIEQGIVQGQMGMGMSSLTHEDLQHTADMVKARVEAVLASGGSLEDAIHASTMGVHPDLARYAQDLAAHQYESSKSLLATAAGQGQETAATMHTIGEMVFGGAAVAAASSYEQDPYTIPDHQRPLDENGKMLSTTALLATANISPDRTPAQQQDRSISMRRA